MISAMASKPCQWSGQWPAMASPKLVVARWRQAARRKPRRIHAITQPAKYTSALSVTVPTIPTSREIVISPVRFVLAVIDRKRVGHSASVIKSSAVVDVPAGLIDEVGFAKLTDRAYLIVLAGGIGEVSLNRAAIIPIVSFLSRQWPPADEPQSKAYAAHEPEALPAIEPCKSTCHRGQA
jgi:hypothetical protein